MSKINSPAEVRIEQLEQIEEDIINILKFSGNCLLEVAKERPSQKAVDNQVQQVMTSIKNVDTRLSDQIKYLTQVSTGHPHEGSSYPSQKVLQSAWHRLGLVKNRLSELDRLRQKSLSQQNLALKQTPTQQPQGHQSQQQQTSQARPL